MQRSLLMTAVCSILFCFSATLVSQNTDSLIIRKLYTEALSNPVAWHNLGTLCENYPGRLCGSQKVMEAITWTKQLLDRMGLDTVFLQPVMVKRWERGDKEVARVISSKIGNHNINVCALGSSIGTGPEGIKSAVIEVKGFDELKKLGRKNIEGKVIFFNRAADPSFIYTFGAYGSAVDQRARGAMQAARYGAIAVVVRSATLAHSDDPHTGIQHYADSVKSIPALGISTNDADKLSAWLKKDPELKLFLRTTCKELPEVQNYNIIAEIRGSVKPKEIIAFGGHIDSWDIEQGAHDDGVGVMQTIEVLRLFKTLDIKPKHTIRVVVFIDEEYAQRGAAAYAAFAKNNGKHIAAIETDRGGFTPQGFSIDAPDETVQKIQSWKPLLLPYNLWSIEKGGSGVDIRDLKPFGVPLIALVTDSQRYFDYQHASGDSFDKVHPREMQLGSAAIASLVYLIDQYGL
jgi:carboxypeptidase Q